MGIVAMRHRALVGPRITDRIIFCTFLDSVQDKMPAWKRLLSYFIFDTDTL